MTDTVKRKKTPIREVVAKRLAKRHRAETRFRLYGVIAIAFAVLALLILLGRLVQQGWQAFWTYEYDLKVYIDPEYVDQNQTGLEADLRRGNYGKLLRNTFQKEFPEVTSRKDLRQLFRLYSSINSSYLLREVLKDPALVGKTHAFVMPVSDNAEIYLKKGAKRYLKTQPESFLDLMPAEEEAGENKIGTKIQLKSSQPVFRPVLEKIAKEIRQEESWKEPKIKREPASKKEEMPSPIESITLTKGTPSILIAAGGGIIKLDRLEMNMAEGHLLSPFGSSPDVFASSKPEKQEKAQWEGLQDKITLDPGNWELIKLPPEARRKISDLQIVWLESLRDRGVVKTVFNRYFFLNANSKEPELAGISSAFWGSVMTILITMGLAIPIGVGAALYLEEFAPKNRFTDIIEVNINNLAAVPSIVFGLLGAVVFINFIHFPRSTPLIGGVVLALMTLPTIIITTRVALKAVPYSIREAALGVGASRMQAVTEHVLPLALPGIMTGSIIGLAQAMGETAPLLMVGMVAFIADLPPFAAQFSEATNLFSGLGEAITHIPESFTSAATVMPVQVYIWSDAAERAFEQRTAAAILALLVMVILLNLLAVYFRRKFERRW